MHLHIHRERWIGGGASWGYLLLAGCREYQCQGHPYHHNTTTHQINTAGQYTILHIHLRRLYSQTCTRRLTLYIQTLMQTVLYTHYICTVVGCNLHALPARPALQPSTWIQRGLNIPAKYALRRMGSSIYIGYPIITRIPADGSLLGKGYAGGR